MDSNAGLIFNITHRLESGINNNWWSGMAIAFRRLMHDGDTYREPV